MRIHVCLLLVIALGGASGCVSRDIESSEANLSVQSQQPDASLVVQGMSCPLCAHNIEQQLLALPEIDRVEINLGAGIVDTWYVPGSEPSFQAIKTALYDSGFSFIEASIHGERAILCVTCSCSLCECVEEESSKPCLEDCDCRPS